MGATPSTAHEQPKTHKGTGLRLLLFGLLSALASAVSGPVQGSKPLTSARYQPTLESLNTHPLPAWYDEAKLGIFVHWGLYSVPGWATLNKPQPGSTDRDSFKNNAYSEWYYNTMMIDGSPTQAYQREHYESNTSYYDFVPSFNRAIASWDPQQWARIFKDAGARYVVLTTKHHEGFTLWPSSIVNPNMPKDRQHADRDLVGDLTKAVREEGMRMGLYYSGGFDWTFIPPPMRDMKEFEALKPQTAAYGAYADAQLEELIRRYHPAVLWNDIDWPKSGHPLQLMADYYNAVPDGVIDDRFGVPHSDFTSPEYAVLDKISAKKWEECRGLGRSFGYNRAEGEEETIKPDDLIYLLADIVSKNGNLLLDVGPEADGTIPPVQLSRLRALGEWLDRNGDAIYGTHPWIRPSGRTAGGTKISFTQKDGVLFAIVLGQPHGQTISIEGVSAKVGSHVRLLGYPHPLQWTKANNNLEIRGPAQLPGKYAYSFEIPQS